MRSNPISSTAIVLVLALGMAGNTTMFSSFYAWILRPLDFEEPDRLVALFETQPRLADIQSGVSPPNFDDWRRQQRSFEAMSIFQRHVFNFEDELQADRIDGVRIASDLFPLLGVEPVLGRNFLAGEDLPGQPASVALISDDLWRDRFGADPGILGGTVRLDGREHRIVGVMKPSFAFPEWADVWTPIGLEPSDHPRHARSLSVLGRLRPGVSRNEAQLDMETVSARLATLHSDTNAGWSVLVKPMREMWAPPVIRIALSATLGAAFFVLLVICANVAGLTLAQASSRVRETALRAALGASRGRLARQAITECTVLALLGGLVAIPLAVLAGRWMLDLAPISPPYLFSSEIDYRAMLYTLVIALITGIACGAAPAIRNSGIDVYEALKSGGLMAGPGRGRARSALVVVELALSTALVIGSLLMVKSFLNQQQIDYGYRTDGLLTARLSLDQEGYRGARDRVGFMSAALDRMEALPEVRSAAATNRLPAAGGFVLGELEVEGRAVEDGERVPAKLHWVTSRYFEVLEIPLISGRSLSQGEAREGAAVALVSRSLSERLWPGLDPLGRRFRVSVAGEGNWLTVIGVAGDVDVGERMVQVGGPSRVHAYLPFFDAPDSIGSWNLVLRSDSSPETLAASMRAELRALAPGVPVSDILSMKQLIWELQWVTRMFGQMMAVYAGMALLVAALGAYGVCADAVSRRTREIAVRSALGAARSDLLRLAMKQGLVLGALGIGSGLVLALGVTRFGASMLLGVSTSDPTVFALVAVFLGIVSSLATYLPALRASRIDVVEALRAD